MSQAPEFQRAHPSRQWKRPLAELLPVLIQEAIDHHDSERWAAWRILPRGMAVAARVVPDSHGMRSEVRLSRQTAPRPEHLRAWDDEVRVAIRELEINGWAMREDPSPGIAVVFQEPIASMELDAADASGLPDAIYGEGVDRVGTEPA